MSAAVIAVISLCSGAIGTASDQTQSKWALERFQYSQLHMGVRVVISCYATNEETAQRACSSAYKRFAELEDVMSDYRPTSEVMKFCAQAGTGPKPISPDLMRVLMRAQEIASLSDGAFDVTCSPLVRLWREARKTKKMPSPFALSDARQRVGYSSLLVDASSGTAELKLPGMQIDLGGIAKGDACDQALIEMKKQGVTRALIECGGDMAAGDPPPGRLGWKVSIKGWDKEELFLDNQALSTSGDSYQFVEIGGKRYSHILDPRTGLGLTDRIQVSILAKNGLTTDSLSKAVMMLGEEKGSALAEKYGARAIFVKEK